MKAIKTGAAGKGHRYPRDGRSTGHPVRALRNEMTKRYLELEQEGASFEELEQLTLGGLRRAVVEGECGWEA